MFPSLPSRPKPASQLSTPNLRLTASRPTPAEIDPIIAIVDASAVTANLPFAQFPPDSKAGAVSRPPGFGE